MKLSIIVAAAKNGIIGRNNQLPWRLPQDLQYFKAITMGKPVIMGRKTYESIGKPLPGRLNIVITRQVDWRAADGVLVVNSVADAISAAEKSATELVNPPEEAMVIGGAEIYREVLSRVDRVYLTRLDIDVEGDAVFPDLPDNNWCIDSITEGDAQAPLKHKFMVYNRTFVS